MTQRLACLGFAFLCCALLAGCGDDDPAATGPSATPTPAAALVVVQPATAMVTTFSFPIEVQASGGVPDPGSVEAKVNGQTIALSGGPTRFVATIHPGAPLRDDNILDVSATFSGRPSTISKTFQYLPPKAVARRITSETEYIHGPLSHGRIGDYLLANSEARFIIQDIAKRDLYSVGAFGGNIIDAELTSRPGTDNFLEIQPAVNLESVINAQTLEIVNDGQDGLPAIIRTCGPDDLLDFVNPSTIIRATGLPFPDAADDKDYNIQGCTNYELSPNKTNIKMVTTIMNDDPTPVGLLVGDFVNASGEVEQWTSSGAGLGEQLTNSMNVLSYIGYGEALGVDYSLVPVPPTASPNLRSSFFTAAGVSYVLHSNSVIQVILGGAPTFVVPGNGQNSFTRYFGIGDGNGGNAVALENEVKGLATGTLRGCVTEGGRPAPGARVSVFKRGVVAPYVTDATGCYEGSLPPNTYQVGALRRGSPHEGAGTTPELHDITIEEGMITVQDIALPNTGKLHVKVVEQIAGATKPMPARISVVGFDPSPEPLLTTTGVQGTTTTGLYTDAIFDPVPFGFTWMDYAGADGELTFDLEPGSYQIFASRGVEYSEYDEPVTITAGSITNVNATLARVLDTTGFISSDFHVHGIRSADSRVSDRNRALQFSGEGIDNVIMTDHHSHTDLNPRIASLGLSDFLHATIGEEVTTWDYGHYNAYPLTIDSTRPSGGSTDWGRAAPPGRDFPAYGAFSLTPKELQELATHGATSTPDTTIQINHIDSFFAPLVVDTLAVPPTARITPAERLAFRLDPNGGELFQPFKALELWNGAGRGAQEEFLNHRLGIWINLLNQGLITTFIADTDTHEFRNLNTAGARTWTAAATDEPRLVDPAQVARSVNAGKAVGGQGIYVQPKLVAKDGSAAVADLTLNGAPTVKSTNGDVDLQIYAQAPLWAEFDQIEIYANAATVPTLTIAGTPVLFTATPTRVLKKGIDFTVDEVDVAPSNPKAKRREAHVTASFTGLSQDTYFIVVVRGTDGVSHPMYPIMAHDLDPATNMTLANLLDGNLGEHGTMALGATNALYADVDGVAGFQAPLAQD